MHLEGPSLRIAACGYRHQPEWKRVRRPERRLKIRMPTTQPAQWRRSILESRRGRCGCVLLVATAAAEGINESPPSSR